MNGDRLLARLPLLLAALFGVLFVLLPLGSMLAQTIFGPDGFSLAPWRELLANDVDRRQLLRSLELGAVATAIAVGFGFGHAWLTEATDLPGRRVLGPLGVAPLVIPPILVAMGFADLGDMAGFWSCAFLLGVSYAPFVAVLTARGMRSIDGRMYEAALLARGRGRAERLLLVLIGAEIAAGALLAFVFVISEHGVPEFLTVKGKTWHTYAEGVFGRWTRRATGIEHGDLAAPIVAALPLIAIVGIALWAALRLRARTTLRGDLRPLPCRPLGVWRWPALLLPLVYLGAGVGVPVVVMARWGMGSTFVDRPISFATLRENLRLALTESGGNLAYTTAIAAAAMVVVILVALPIAQRAARGNRWLEPLSAIPVAVPAILLAIGFVHTFNTDFVAGIYDFYDTPGIVVAAYAARFLPFGVLTLAAAARRIPRELGEAARLSGRGRTAAFWRVQFPLLLPAAWSAACLVFILGLRELDVAVVLPSGNGTVVRSLSNIVHFGGEDRGGAMALLLLSIAVLAPALTVLLTGRRLRSLS